MKKYFLLFSIFSLFPIVWVCPAGAEKRYRYIKREHGVHFNMAVPVKNLSGGADVEMDVKGAYTYNWKGMLEFGPYFAFDSQLSPAFILDSWDGGLLVEYNFIKNRGKRKFIPAIGISFGVNGMQEVTSFSGGVHGALKIFVGKRTPFTVSLGYRMLTPMESPFQHMDHNIHFSTGFSYYFDFY